MISNIFNYIITNQFLISSLILAIVMISNIILGSANAKLLESFDVKKYQNGIFKAFMIWLSMALLYLAGAIKPDMLVVNVDGLDITIKEAINTVFVGAIAKYTTDSIIKLFQLFKIKKEGE